MSKILLLDQPRTSQPNPSSARVDWSKIPSPPDVTAILLPGAARSLDLQNRSITVSSANLVPSGQGMAYDFSGGAYVRFSDVGTFVCNGSFPAKEYCAVAVVKSRSTDTNETLWDFWDGVDAWELAGSVGGSIPSGSAVYRVGGYSWKQSGVGSVDIRGKGFHVVGFEYVENNYLRYYVDGALAAELTGIGTPAAAYPSYNHVLQIGARVGGYDPLDGQVAFFLHSRKAFGHQWLQKTTNPQNIWQLFAPEQIPIFIPEAPGNALTLSALTASLITSSGCRATVQVAR